MAMSQEKALSDGATVGVLSITVTALAAIASFLDRTQMLTCCNDNNLLVCRIVKVGKQESSGLNLKWMSVGISATDGNNWRQLTFNKIFHPYLFHVV